MSISAGGLSGNKEERPTRRVYIEILTCRAIFYHLEESRSHGNEREAERARGQGARPGTSTNHRMEYTITIVELIEMHILFAIFGVQNQEILIKEGLHIKELRD